ncbi:MAG TPA: hypothetical protein VM639_18050 [Dongiaceae bacterium]|nr:hypothetical protein [Dongiaceae bacterium]
MLVTKPSKRDNIGLLDRQLRYDICESDRTRGALIFDPKERRGVITIGSDSFVAARLSSRPDEVMYQALFRLMTGAPKPPTTPFALKDSDEQVLALAERNGRGFSVTRGSENFALRRRGMFSRLYELGPEAGTPCLGTVGQPKLFTRQLQIDLPASLPPAFQVFLLTLILDLTLQNMESLSN